jgi:hypothetical protein
VYKIQCNETPPPPKKKNKEREREAKKKLKIAFYGTSEQLGKGRSFNVDTTNMN